MTRIGVAVSIALLLCSAATAAEVWKSTFDTDADGVVDVFDNNPANVVIGTASGGKLPISVQDSAGYAQTDRAGRPLGVTLDGHMEYSGLITFQYAAAPPNVTTYTWLGFIGGGGSNPGIARQVVGALMTSYKSGENYYVYPQVQWGSSSGQDRNKSTTPVNLGADPTGKTFQLAIGYQGDYNLNTNSVNNGTGNMYVAMYDAAGNLLSQTVQGDITGGDGGGQVGLITGLGGGPEKYPDFLSNQQITHLGATDYVTLKGVTVHYLFDSMAWYDTRDGAKQAVVPEPAAALLLLGGLGMLRRRRA